MPERVVRLEGNAGLILRLCDGDHTTAQNIVELSAQFPDAPVAAEVTGFLKRVKEEGWLK
jgi:pyrroloquinoline quinone biosynthesis protein D